MKFWEAMKALQEGKTIDRPLIWPKQNGLHKDSAIDGESHILRISKNCIESDDWKILEGPRFYWQWRDLTGFLCMQGAFLTKEEVEDKEEMPDSAIYEKHAGPWIKSKIGFEKHESWEQF